MRALCCVGMCFVVWRRFVLSSCVVLLRCDVMRCKLLRCVVLCCVVLSFVVLYDCNWRCV